MFLTYIFYWNTFNFNVNSDLFISPLYLPLVAVRRILQTQGRKRRETNLRKTFQFFSAFVYSGLLTILFCVLLYLFWFFPDVRNTPSFGETKIFCLVSFLISFFCLFFIFQLYGVVLPLTAECGKSVDRWILKNNLFFSTQLVNWLKILTQFSKICLYLFYQIYFFVCLFFIFLTFLCLVQWQLIFQSTFLYWNLLKTAFLSVITDTEQDTHFV